MWNQEREKHRMQDYRYNNNTREGTQKPDKHKDTTRETGVTKGN